MLSGATGRMSGVAGVVMMVGVGLLAACSEPTAPNGEMGLNIALRQVSGVEDFLSAGVSKAGAAETMGPGGIPKECEYAGGMFFCPTETQSANGSRLTVTRAYKLLDEDGYGVPMYETRYVRAVQVQTNASGSFTQYATDSAPPTAVTFSSTIDDTLNVAGGRRLLSGTSTTSATLVTNGKAATSQSVQLFTNIAPATTPIELAKSIGLPVSGTVMSIITGTDTTGATIPMTTVATSFTSPTTYRTIVTRAGVTATWDCTVSRGAFERTTVVCSRG